MNKRMKNLVRGIVGAVLLTAATIGTTYAQADKRVWVTNHSSQSVWRLYYSSPGESWGRDRLGDQIIAAGRERRFNVSDGGGCAMDMKAVMRNGEEHTRFRVDVCSLYRWNLYDGSSTLDYAD